MQKVIPNLILAYNIKVLLALESYHYVKSFLKGLFFNINICLMFYRIIFSILNSLGI